MGATLATLRRYIRAEVNDPAPLEKLSTLTITHDGGSAEEDFFQDASYNFVTLGVIVGDVIYNTSDGGSLAVIRQIADGAATNDRLYVSSIEGGTENDYDNGDVVEIYDRHAQRGLDGTRWTDSEVGDALAQAQKLVAMRHGGVRTYSLAEDIKVMSKINIVNISGTLVVGEQVSGGDNDHQATIEYVASDFIITSRFITRVPMDNVTGTFLVGENVTGLDANGISQTGVVTVVSGAYLDLYAASGEFADNAELTGGTSGATCDVDAISGYSSGLFVADEVLTGATSTATCNVKATYAANNIYVGQDLPTDLKHLVNARWWNGSQWMYLKRESIFEYELLPKTSGDPLAYNVYAGKLWFWPNNATFQYNEIHLTYIAWDATLSADTDTTQLEIKLERLTVLESAKVLAGSANEDQLFARISRDIQTTNDDIDISLDSEVRHVTQLIDWDSGYGPGEVFEL